MDFGVPADHKVKLKACKKYDKYLTLARELKEKLWNIKVTLIPVEIRLGKRTGELGNKSKSGENPNNSIAKTVQNTTKCPGEAKTLCHSDSCKKPLANTCEKNSQKSKIICAYQKPSHLLDGIYF